MPSRTDTAEHTKVFHYPVMDHWGESQNALAQGRIEQPTHWSTVEHTNNQTTMTASSQRISTLPGPQRGRGNLLPPGGIVCENSPSRVGHSQAAPIHNTSVPVKHGTTIPYSQVVPCFICFTLDFNFDTKQECGCETRLPIYLKHTCMTMIHVNMIL